MKNNIKTLAREISVCCGTSCSKDDSLSALKDLVVEITFFKERYDLMKKTLRDANSSASEIIDTINSMDGLSINDKNKLALPLSNFVDKNNALLIVDINSELNKLKNNDCEKGSQLSL